MNTENTASVELVPASNAAPAAPTHSIASVAIVTKAGKTVGARYSFTGQGMSAKEVRESLAKQNPGLSSKKLKAKVNEVLSGASPLAWAAFEVFVSGLRSDGKVPLVGEVRQNGNASVKFVEAEAEKPKVTAEAVAAMSAEEKAKLLALLTA